MFDVTEVLKNDERVDIVVATNVFFLKKEKKKDRANCVAWSVSTRNTFEKIESKFRILRILDKNEIDEW